jgi:predicted TIM-barrel fold metal-dependent hydrolase
MRSCSRLIADAAVGLGRLGLLFLAVGALSCSCSGRYSKIDAHCHLAPEAVPRAIELMDRYGISVAVNLSGGSPGRGLEEQLKAAARFPGRIVVFAGLDWYEPTRGPGYGTRMAASVARAHQLGARGLEIPRGLGIGFLDSKGARIRIDEPELDPVFEKAAELGMPVAIHAGAPVAYWLPAVAKNERYEELKAHPELSLNREAPPWETLFLGLERRIAKHPQCTFISVHFGNAAEYPTRVAALLDRYRNLYIDTAGRIPELGRHSSGEMKKLIADHADRILFGSDLSIGPSANDVVLSSQGVAPPTRAEVDRFFAATWRYFETTDQAFDHPTPIQGNWKISGVGLSSRPLRKIYANNAERLLNIQLP